MGLGIQNLTRNCPKWQRLSDQKVFRNPHSKERGKHQKEFKKRRGDLDFYRKFLKVLYIPHLFTWMMTYACPHACVQT